MTPQVTCSTCRAQNPPGARFCLACGRPVVAHSQHTWRYWRAPVALTLLGIVAFIIYVQPTTPDRSSVAPSARSIARVSTADAAERFRAKIMGVPDGKNIFLNVLPGEVEGVVRVQVSQAWFNSRPHQRKQLTQMLADVWRQEMGDQPSILHVYDIAGREVAGTRAFGGVWIEDE